MKIAENHIMFFFSLLKPDHGFDIWKKKHDLVFMKIAENHIMFFFSLLKPDHGFDIWEKSMIWF